MNGKSGDKQKIQLKSSSKSDINTNKALKRKKCKGYILDKHAAGRCTTSGFIQAEQNPHKPGSH
jgi:hypothetical protein